jgi:hypothetical protein
MGGIGKEDELQLLWIRARIREDWTRAGLPVSVLHTNGKIDQGVCRVELLKRILCTM